MQQAPPSVVHNPVKMLHFAGLPFAIARGEEDKEDREEDLRRQTDAWLRGAGVSIGLRESPGGREREGGGKVEAGSRGRSRTQATDKGGEEYFAWNGGGRVRRYYTHAGRDTPRDNSAPPPPLFTNTDTFPLASHGSQRWKLSTLALEGKRISYPCQSFFGWGFLPDRRSTPNATHSPLSTVDRLPPPSLLLHCTPRCPHTHLSRRPVGRRKLLAPRQSRSPPQTEEDRGVKEGERRVKRRRGRTSGRQKVGGPGKKGGENGNHCEVLSRKKERGKGLHILYTRECFHSW